MSHPARNSTEVLEAARWMIDHVGWVQEHYHTFADEDGSMTAFCAEGAIMSVIATSGKHNVNALARLGKVVPGGNVVRFNDNKKTTKEKVIDAFDRAIKKGVKR